MYTGPWDEIYTLHNQDAAQDTLASEMVLSEEREDERERNKTETENGIDLLSFCHHVN